jgi:hypothetical protein
VDYFHPCCGTKPALMSLAGPKLPTWALQQVVGYLGYTGRDANVVAKAARNPMRKSRSGPLWLRIGDVEHAFDKTL